MKLLLIFALFAIVGAWIIRRSRERKPKVLYIGLNIDMLQCFDDDGSLAVKGCHKLLAGINRLTRALNACANAIWYLIQDFHPEGHESFFTMHAGKKFLDQITLYGILQVLWWEHAVQGRKGLDSPDFIDGLVTEGHHKIIQKGMDKRVDSYSAFYNNGVDAAAEVKAQYPFLGTSTGLAEDSLAYAEAHNYDEVVYICYGVAGDFCDAFTAIDARRQVYRGKKVRVIFITDLTAYIQPVEEEILKRLRELGIETKTLAEVEAILKAAA